MTGEIGWDQPEVRTGICTRLGLLGVVPDPGPDLEADGVVGGADGAAVPVVLVRTREQCRLTLEASSLLSGSGNSDAVRCAAARR